MTHHHTKIRLADRADLPHILHLVQQLATFEKAPEQVTATLEDYLDAFDREVFSALVATIDGTIVGAAVYFLSWSTWRGRMLYLEDFIVADSYRNRGIGQLLFDAYLQEAKRLRCVMVKWQVLDWNEAAIRFYQRNGATIEKEWWNGKIIF